MPLKPGKSQAVIAENIRRGSYGPKAGKKPAQAVAIAHSVANKAKKPTLKTMMKANPV